jgi:hypothetical protein
VTSKMITQKVDLYSDSDTEPDRGNVLAHIVWKGKEHGLYDGENIIGREDDCDVVLDHESVSLKHAVLDFENGAAKLRDLKSKNGTSVESVPGGGSYVKLGPMRRNVIVSSGSRIRFGLVDCKFVHVGGSPADKPAPSNLNINCETQFINLGPIEDDDSEEEEAEAFPAGKAAPSGGSALPHPVPEQDTQVAASLTSAEKAPAAYLHSPSPLNFISGLVGSSRTPLAVGNASIGIGYSHSPPSGGTVGSADALLRRTASSKASPASAVRAPPLATSSPNDTDVDDETEDEGGAMDQDELPPPPAAPMSRPPPPVGRDLDTTLMGDSDDDGSEMSQDLLRVADAAEPAEDNEHDDDGGRDDPGHAASEQRGVADLVGTQSEHGDEDEEINFAQPEARTADSTVGPTSVRGPQRTGSLSDALGSPFHGIGESTAYFTADSHPDGPGAAPHEPNLSQVLEPMVEEEETANTEQKGRVTASLESLSDLPVTASSNGGVPATSPSARSRSATVDEADEGKTRSPATAIQNLLQRSGMKDGARVFNTQGDIISMGHSGTGSPRLTSQSSAPPDAPKLGFDFAAARDAPPPLLDAADRTGGGKADDEDEAMDVESPMPAGRRAKAAARVSRDASAAPSSAPGVRAARKRVLEDSDDDEDSPVTESGPASARKSRQGAASGPGGTASKERNVRARKTRSNDPGDAGAPLPVTTEVPFSPSKKQEGAETAKRKRFLDDGSEEEAEFAADDGLVTHSVGPAKAPSPEAKPKTIESKPAAKKGRRKSAAERAGGEEQGEGAEEAQTASTASAVKKGRGRVGFAAEEAVLEEPAAPAEPAEPVAPTAAKKGRGKKQVSEGPPEAAERSHDETAETSTKGKKAAAPAKKGTKKASAEAPAPADTDQQVTAVEEPPAAAAAVKSSAKKSTKKGEQAVSEAPVRADAASAPAPAAGKKAGNKGAVARVVENVHDATAAAEEAGTSSAATAADNAVRVMFTKVEDGPYLKGLKSLPHVSVVADATEATHCVTLSELKRTPKLMVALNCGAQYVVTEQWAKDCVKSKSVVDVVSAEHAAVQKGSKLPKDLDPRVNPELYQQLLSSPYIVHDAEKEKLWKFSLAATLAIPRHQPGERKLFEGLCFFCTKGVCGETAPPADELCAIIESGGGVWLTSLEDWLEHHAQAKGASPAGKGGSSSKSGGKGKAGAVGASGNDVQSSPALVVLTHPNVMKKEVTKKVSDAVAKCNAPAAGVYSMELVFLACLRQRMDFDESRL